MGKRTFKQYLSLLLVPFQLFSLSPRSTTHDEIKDEDTIDYGYYQTEEIIRVEYEIKNGDTLINLASKYKVDMDEVRSLNNIDDNMISEGNKIFMDVSRTIFNRYCNELVRVDIKNENIIGVDTSMDVVLDGFKIEYEIVVGDTLSEIASRFGVQLSQIEGYEDESKIYVGDKLVITGVSNEVYERYMREQLGNVIEYEIVAGDTITGIANRFGVKAAQIQGYEDESKIYVGDKLLITDVSNEVYERYMREQLGNVIEYEIVAGDTITGIANRFGVKADQIQGYDDESKIYVGDKLVITGVSNEVYERYMREQLGNVIEYEIVAGDTITGIANRFGVKADQIQGYDDESKIYVGDKLVITGVSNEVYERYNSGINIITEENNTLDTNEMVDRSIIQDGYLRGIDISKHQGKLDWDVMQKNYENGVFDYIILRIADNVKPGTYDKVFTVDSRFEENLSECNKRCIPYTVYEFSRKTTVDGIKEEANSLINYINNNLNTMKELEDGTALDLTFNPSLPIYFDCFEDDASSQRKILDNRNYDLCVELIVEWCKVIESAGFYPGVYYHLDAERQLGHLLDEITIGEFNIPINRWVAYYGKKDFADDIRKIEEIGFPDVHVTEMTGNIYSYQVEEDGVMPGIKKTYFDVNIIDEALFDMVREYYSARRNAGYEFTDSYVTSRRR